MQIYYQKKRWKLLLFASAVMIVVISLWYTNLLVREIAKDERRNISVWANAIQHKAELVNYTKDFFDEIRIEEQKRAEIFAAAFNYSMYDEGSQALNLYLMIMQSNTNIPVVVTDQNDSILTYRNLDESLMQNHTVMDEELQKEFSVFEPIRYVQSIKNKNYIYNIYYKESLIFLELRQVLDNLVESFFSEVVGNSASVPVIITDSTQQNILEYGNIDSARLNNPEYVRSLISEMSDENDPIIIELPDRGTNFIYYMDSALLTQIMFYPYIQFIVIGLFLFIAYILFSIARKSEQNLVWIGMSKETAHQLGTPLSSIIAWIELLKIKGVRDEGISEIEKDVKRLENITDRFSKIGSPPKLEPHNIVDVIYESVDYLRPRTSKKVIYEINLPPGAEVFAPINKQLFEWVIENLCKNAVDAMTGVGKITINIIEDNKNLIVDIGDTGKGIPKGSFKSVFSPGFTNKKRGWGLGLSLSKRIIENYHKGKIFVKSSVVDKGTVMRISLKR